MSERWPKCIDCPSHKAGAECDDRECVNAQHRRAGKVIGEDDQPDGSSCATCGKTMWARCFQPTDCDECCEAKLSDTDRKHRDRGDEKCEGCGCWTAPTHPTADEWTVYLCNKCADPSPSEGNR